MSSGSVSKSSAMTILPASRPAFRSVLTPKYGTRRAIGIPAVPMRTSSPWETASISAESSAFASEMLLTIIYLSVVWSGLTCKFVR